MKHHSISLREANQNFSRVIAAVERGESFCITRRGQEVAQLLPSSTARAPTPPAKSRPFGKGLQALPMPVQDTTLGARLHQLEARMDKLSAAIPPTITQPSPA